MVNVGEFAKVGDFVRSDDDKYWLVCYELIKNNTSERILICFRDGVRRFFTESSVERISV